jgi:hypothetical protein
MSAFGGKSDIVRRPDHTFEISLQICEGACRVIGFCKVVCKRPTELEWTRPHAGAGLRVVMATVAPSVLASFEPSYIVWCIRSGECLFRRRGFYLK